MPVSVTHETGRGYFGGGPGTASLTENPDQTAARMQQWLLANRQQDFEREQADAGRGQQAGLQDSALAARMRELQAQIGSATTLQQGDIAGQMSRLQANLGQQRYDTDATNLTRRQGDQLAADSARNGQQLQYNLGQDQLGFQKDRFGQVFGAVQGQLGGGLDAAPIRTVGSSAPTQVLTGDQVQQQVNASRAGLDRRAETQAADAGRSLAGRGFGANSGLGFALGQMARGQAASAGADQEREIRLGAARDNAQQGTAAAQLGLQAGMANQDADLKRRGIAAQRQSSLLSSLASLA